MLSQDTEVAVFRRKLQLKALYGLSRGSYPPLRTKDSQDLNLRNGLVKCED